MKLWDFVIGHDSIYLRILISCILLLLFIYIISAITQFTDRSIEKRIIKMELKMWNKFPNKKPTKNNYYIAIVKLSSYADIEIEDQVLYWMDNKWIDPVYKKYIDNVIKWREIPKSHLAALLEEMRE